MLIGVPKEVKDQEHRVALTPAGVRVLRQARHQVLVEASAGQGSGFSDEEYRQAGAEAGLSKDEVFRRAELIVKVKEPQASECGLLRAGQILFTYLHLASLPELTKSLMASHVTAIAYETVEARDRSLPMLRPMSEIAGRLSVQVGAITWEWRKEDEGCYWLGCPESSLATWSCWEPASSGHRP